MSDDYIPESDPLDQRFDHTYEPEEGMPQITHEVHGYWALNPSEREFIDLFMQMRARHRDRVAK